MIAQAVGHTDGGRGVGHPHVHVQRAGRCAGDEAAHVVGDPAIAFVIDVPDVAERLGRVDSRSEQVSAGGDDGRAQPAQLLDGLRRAPAHRRGELQQCGIEIRSGQGRSAPQRRPELSGPGVEGMVAAAHDQQLLFNADREWLAARERRYVVADRRRRRSRGESHFLLLDPVW